MPCSPTVLVLRVLIALALLASSACADLKELVDPYPDYTWLVANPARSDADRSTDQRRQPEKLLQFYGLRPGMHVLDLGAGAGYNTELIARAVGPQGIVYAQNSPAMLENVVKGRLDERLKRGSLGNVSSVAREFEDPVPPDVRNLDLVTFMFLYHDITYMGVDRAKMNR